MSEQKDKALIRFELTDRAPSLHPTVIKLCLGREMKAESQEDVDMICDELGIDCFTFDWATYVRSPRYSEEPTQPIKIKGRLRRLIERILLLGAIMPSGCIEVDGELEITHKFVLATEDAREAIEQIKCEITKDFKDLTCGDASETEQLLIEI